MKHVVILIFLLVGLGFLDWSCGSYHSLFLTKAPTSVSHIAYKITLFAENDLAFETSTMDAIKTMI
jgi:hypothetical protein